MTSPNTEPITTRNTMEINPNITFEEYRDLVTKLVRFQLGYILLNQKQVKADFQNKVNPEESAKKIINARS